MPVRGIGVPLRAPGPQPWPSDSDSQGASALARWTLGLPCASRAVPASRYLPQGPQSVMRERGARKCTSARKAGQGCCGRRRDRGFSWRVSHASARARLTRDPQRRGSPQRRGTALRAERRGFCGLFRPLAHSSVAYCLLYSAPTITGISRVPPSFSYKLSLSFSPPTRLVPSASLLQPAISAPPHPCINVSR